MKPKLEKRNRMKSKSEKLNRMKSKLEKQNKMKRKPRLQSRLKLKPKKQQSRNTFRFQGFTEKIRNIQVNARKYIINKIEPDSDAQTHLYETVNQWKNLNCTIGFRVKFFLCFCFSKANFSFQKLKEDE